MAARLRIIVGGMMGLFSVGGWNYLQHAVGLARLGHDVTYHEDTRRWPYHPLKETYVPEGDYSAGYIGNFVGRFAPELQGRWHYLHLGERSFGMGRAAFEEVARTADLFLNVGGACVIPDSLSPGCLKVFLDTDPGYNQIVMSERFDWSENVESWCKSVAAHDRHFTFAENILGPDCAVPKLGFAWQAARPPVVMDLWERVARVRPPQGLPWTTVMTWNPFGGKLFYQGVEYGGKGDEFERLIDLPRRTRVPLLIALGGMSAPIQRLAEEGWRVVDAPSATLTPGLYQEFIAASRGELSPAKHVYVAMRTGWFSERSACYLAAGRPVIAQDTGFSKFLPTGRGLLAFATAEEALDALERVHADYEAHARAAREIAEEHFAAERVLGDLLNRAAL